MNAPKQELENFLKDNVRFLRRMKYQGKFSGNPTLFEDWTRGDKEEAAAKFIFTYNKWDSAKFFTETRNSEDFAYQVAAIFDSPDPTDATEFFKRSFMNGAIEYSQDQIQEIINDLLSEIEEEDREAAEEARWSA